jgi:hypothetical protein
VKTIRGKNLKATAYDIAEGFTIVNPLLLKPLDNETITGLYKELIKVQAEIRSEKFPHSNINAIRMRNVKLQRLHSSAMVVRNYARERKIILV